MDPTDKKQSLERLTGIIAWIQIALSPTLVGLVIGFLIFRYYPSSSGTFGAILSATIGLMLGILWANNVRKKHGTVWFISRSNATQESESKGHLKEDSKQ